jgi:hypothetical protein
MVGTWASMARPTLLSGSCQLFLSGTSTGLSGRGPGQHNPNYKTTRGVTTKEVKQWALTRHSKWHSKPMFTRLPYSSYIAPGMTAQDMTVVSQTGSMIAEGSAKAQGYKVKPASWVNTAQSK